ncbi:placenta-specific protein 9-like [Eucyclogobius newberryi]|uniref:placenta-specific protein 9-like n=1 Tax=Eucyclogobius newberryi TaxID=166745 RepID=UPI003B5BC20B
MRRLHLAALGLFWLLIGCVSAEPDVDLRPRAVRLSVCQEHTNLHNRLDAVEKTVEDTVEKLEEELVGLLDTMEDPQWSPPVDTTGMKTVDVLEDPER